MAAAQPLSGPLNYNVKNMTFDLWCLETQRYPQERCQARSPADVKAWRRANAGMLWLTGIAIVFLGTIPVLNLLVPVVGTAAMTAGALTAALVPSLDVQPSYPRAYVA